MIEDKNKAIVITYNYMNLPSKVEYEDGRTIEYLYGTDGTKRRMVVKDPSVSLETNTDYLNAVVYEDGVIDYLVMDEGLVKNESGEYRYHYYLQDHLGNTRAVFKNDGGNVATLIQANSYYPFGLEMPELSYVGGSGETRYKYNGKEMQDAFSLNWIDYGARFYDPQIGRWHVVDKLASEPEQVDKSPYAYAWNNPVKLNDPDGNCPSCIGALIGAAVDIAIQAVEIGMDDKKTFSNDFSYSSVGVSALAGATGAGLVSKVEKLGTVAKIGIELAHDVAAAALNQQVTEGKVDIQSAAVSAIGGKVAGDITGKVVSKQVAKSTEGKVLLNHANRAERVAANNSRPARTQAATEARKKAVEYFERRSVAASTASSGIVGNMAETISEKKKK